MAEEEEMSDGGHEEEASLPEWRRLERALLASLLGVRNAYRRRFTADVREEMELQQPPQPPQPQPPQEEEREERDARQPDSALDWLPLGVQLYTMSFLGARDLSSLASVSRLWRCLASDPLLWRRLLLRDALAWRCVGRVGMPDVRALTRPHLAVAADFKAMYARGHAENPSRAAVSRRAAPGVVARLPQLLRAALGAGRVEPRFAMFGPGLERLRVSLVHQLLSSPNEFRVAPSLQQHPHAGSGSGISFVFDEERTFNILTLYSATKSERERGADAPNGGVAPDKLLVLDVGASWVRGQEDSEPPPSRASRRYRPTAHVQDVCRHVDAFIYVANAEAGPGEPQRDTADEKKAEGGGSADETARVSAMLEAGPPGSPLLVLACTSEPSTVRVPSLLLAHRLRLQALPRAWLVCAAEASSLGGVREGISWLLHSLSCGDWLSGD